VAAPNRATHAAGASLAPIPEREHFTRKETSHE
jgi:hypothetical protein